MQDYENMTQEDAITVAIAEMYDTGNDLFKNVLMDTLPILFKSIITFGPTSNEVKECLKVIKEMHLIVKKEGKLLDKILQNLHRIDLDETSDMIDTLTDLSEKTYDEYSSILSSIEISCDMKEHRTLRPRSGINTLLTNKKYEEKVKRLTKQKEVK